MFQRLNGSRRKSVVVCVLVALIAAGVSLLPDKKPKAAAVLPAPTAAADQATRLGSLPLHFEQNQGQTDARVRYLARGSGYALFLTPSEAVLSLRGAEKSAVVRMQLAGANPAAEIAGVGELPGKVNYFRGRNSAQWRTNLSTFERVRYSSVYPGVDLVYYGTGSQLEYDFIVSPGTDPSVISLKFDGADHLEVDAKGELVLSTSGGAVRMRKPVVYQESNGERREVAGAFELRGDGRVAFVVGDYDRSEALVIDPVMTYFTYLGGTEFEQAMAIKVDLAGNTYVIGPTLSADFPTVGGLPDASYHGNQDVFVSKLNAAGTALVYSTFLGGSSGDYVGGLDIDSSGNAYVGGQTESSDFPVTAGAYDESYNGNFDGFVAKLNASGSALLYSTFIGGTGGDNCLAIAVDSSGNAYVTGATDSSDYPITNSAFDTSQNGSSDAFVTKFDATASGLFYSTYLGGSAVDSGLGIAVDTSGNAFVTGLTTSSDFPLGPSPFDATYGGDSDAFLTRVSPSGASLPYSTYVGGTGIDEGHAIAVDSDSNAYITGRTTSTDFPVNLQGVDTTFNGVQDVFVFKMHATGVQLYGTYLGGTGNDNSHAIAVDFAGSVFVTGVTNSTDFPTTAGSTGTISGTVDAYLTRLTPSGHEYAYSTYLGGSGVDSGRGVTVDSAGHAYVSGQTDSSDFNAPDGGFDSSYNGNTDAFITQITSTADLSITMTDSPDPVRSRKELTYSVSVTNSGDDAVVDAVVIDQLPSGVTFNSATPSQGSCQLSSGVLNCQLGTVLALGSATIQIVVTPQAGGTLVNQADVSSSMPDPVGSNNTAVVTTTVSGAVTADLSLTMTDSPDPATVGQNLTYDITINNLGPNPATNVTVTDALPSNVNVVSMSPSQGSCSPGITCNLGTINSGGSATVQIVIQPTRARRLRNTASVTATERDPVANNNRATTTTEVNP